MAMMWICLKSICINWNLYKWKLCMKENELLIFVGILVSNIFFSSIYRILQDKDPFFGIMLISAYVCLYHDSVMKHECCMHLSDCTQVGVKIIPLGTCYFSNLYCFVISNINLTIMETHQLSRSVSFSILNMIDIWKSIHLVIM